MTTGDRLLRRRREQYIPSFFLFFYLFIHQCVGVANAL